MPANDGGLRKLFTERIKGVHWQAIETGGTGRGVPDLNGCFEGRDIWIEMKKADHWAVGIWPEQVAWIERRTRAGGLCRIAVRRDGDELWLLRPEAARIIATPRQSLRDVPAGYKIGVWPGGPRAWPWDDIALKLFSQ